MTFDADVTQRIVVELGVYVDHEDVLYGGHGLCCRLLLQIERRADDVDRVLFQITSLRHLGCVQRNKLLEFCTAIHDSMMGSENDLKQLCDRPSDDTL